jgi:hypothetical protein
VNTVLGSNGHGPEACLHEVAGVAGRGDEEELHGGVVERDVVRRQVEVARDEHGRVQRLRLERDAWFRGQSRGSAQSTRERTSAGLVQAHSVDQNQDRRKVRQVACVRLPFRTARCRWSGRGAYREAGRCSWSFTRGLYNGGWPVCVGSNCVFAGDVTARGRESWTCLGHVSRRLGALVPLLLPPSGSPIILCARHAAVMCEAGLRRPCAGGAACPCGGRASGDGRKPDD